MRIHYNSPVVLTFTLLAMIVMTIDPLTDSQLILSAFTVFADGSLADPMTWFRMFSHILGHASWEHLLGNFAVILLIGPILEEKYGSVRLLMMILFTAFITGMCVTLFFKTGLVGASGVAFMMILLGSFANARAGSIPLTFILVAVIYLGREIFSAFADDQISQMAHIIGGVVGAGLGFFLSPPDPKAKIATPVTKIPVSTPVKTTSTPAKPASDPYKGTTLSAKDLNYGMEDDDLFRSDPKP